MNTNDYQTFLEGCVINPVSSSTSVKLDSLEFGIGTTSPRSQIQQVLRDLSYLRHGGQTATPENIQSFVEVINSAITWIESGIPAQFEYATIVLALLDLPLKILTKHGRISDAARLPFLDWLTQQKFAVTMSLDERAPYSDRAMFDLYHEGVKTFNLFKVYTLINAIGRSTTISTDYTVRFVNRTLADFSLTTLHENLKSLSEPAEVCALLSGLEESHWKELALVDDMKNEWVTVEILRRLFALSEELEPELIDRLKRMVVRYAAVRRNAVLGLMHLNRQSISFWYVLGLASGEVPDENFEEILLSSKVRKDDREPKFMDAFWAGLYQANEERCNIYSASIRQKWEQLLDEQIKDQEFPLDPLCSFKKAIAYDIHNQIETYEQYEQLITGPLDSILSLQTGWLNGMAVYSTFKIAVIRLCYYSQLNRFCIPATSAIARKIIIALDDPRIILKLADDNIWKANVEIARKNLLGSGSRNKPVEA